MKQISCPHCKKIVQELINGVWPFCSERCKMSDLGAWMREEYVIPGKPLNQLEAEQLFEGSDSASELEYSGSDDNGAGLIDEGE